MHPEYHKGQLCVYQLILCQEGYCSECAIHYHYQGHRTPADEALNPKKLVKARRKEQLVSS